MRVSFSIIFALFFLCCKKEGEDPVISIKQDGLWPLNLNNEWTYRRTFYDSDGSVESFNEENTKITDTFTVKGQLYFTNTVSGETFTNIGLNSVRKLVQDSSLTDPHAILFQRVFTNDTIIWKIDIDTCENNFSFRGYTGVTTINGFECLKNQRLLATCDGILRHKEVTYLQPGVGLVRFEEYIPDVNNELYLRVSVDLTSYKLY